MKGQHSTLSTQTQPLIAQFFRASAGHWHSQRRYYTLPQGNVKEITSEIWVNFLEAGCEDLRRLEVLHQFPPHTLLCGAKVYWKSENDRTGKTESEDSTIFGALGNTLYRDRGYAIATPVTAQYHFTNPNTLCLRTEYHGSVFEEELKLLSERYRTRQTIISRAGQEIMIGQYLEKRMKD